jgi:hypothetical protein
VVVYLDNTVIAEYDLTHDRVFTVHGREGPVVFEIRNGAVSVRSSTCRRQICARTPPVSGPFSQIVCAPNHVLAEIRGGAEEDKPDGVAR